jgi:ABC-type transport system substrate-binding protein
MVGFGAEGGVYESAWGEITTSDDGLATTLRLSTAAMSRGLTPNAIALQLAEMAKSGGGASQADFAALVNNIRIEDGQAVVATWRRPNLRPAAFLQVPLKWLTSSERSPGLWFDLIEGDDPTQQRYQRTGANNSAAADEPRFIVEQVFQADDEAVEALVLSDIDVVDRIYPWQAARIQETEGVTLGAYRMPTIHVLIPNFKNPLLETREFRRAICYGIDSESIVREILLGGESRPGFRTLSGPFAAGVSLNDPVGYAYNSEIGPRPYEPRLAALLAGVARQTVAKREAEAKKKQQEANEAVENSESADKSPKADAESDEDAAEDQAPPPAPLLLAHSGDAIARLACQTIKIQLDGVGIPIKLVEFSGSAPPADTKYDLLYAELALWEPLFGTRGLLGQGGLAGRTSPLIGLALDQLAQAENWNEARAQLKEIHRIAHYDLPVLPLWQTANYFAYRDSVSGVGADPVTLYQNLSAWRKSFK